MLSAIAQARLRFLSDCFELQPPLTLDELRLERVGTYPNGKPAYGWAFRTVHPSELVVTVNVPELLTYPDTVVCIKDYNEGAGNLALLIEGGFCKPPIAQVQSGWVTLPFVEVIL